MTEQELDKKHEKEWDDFAFQYRQSHHLLLEGENELLRPYNFKEENAPEVLRTIINQRKDEWLKEWGVDGWRGKKMLEQQQEERKSLTVRDQIINDIKLNLQKEKERTRGR